MKKIPTSIGIFGATGHIGGPMASWLRHHAPEVKLRLITSDVDKAARLRANFPGCEVVIGSYFDLPSLKEAVAGMEGLFVVTTTFTPEAVAMTNLIDAIRSSNTLVHLIRLVGEIPCANLRRVPEVLVKFGLGIELQHPIARQLLNESDLPVTYFNIGASFMDNFLKPLIYSREPPKLIWPDRPVPYIDPRDIAEAAARVLLSDNHRYLYQFHTLDNGSDNLCMSEIVAMMGDVLLCKIEYDSSKESLLAVLRQAVQRGSVPPELPEYLWNYISYEEENSIAWALNDFLARTLGRKPNTMRAWLQEHRRVLAENLGIAC